ncbi:(Fe-S)-binding protein [Candidatus Eisenbacteria bacterium]|uniref:(Fe-S)-binding protein n=1 Tax=Eiseniibacteriota bacterium TaxID=2212470 RepID=A0ABV6YIC3_UNCEI
MALAESALLTGVRAFSCLECGRCTAVCPVARYQKFSPRRLISRMLSGGLEGLSADVSLWACLTCNRCQQVCPTGVDYDEFILGLRNAAVRFSSRGDTGDEEIPAPAAAENTAVKTGTEQKGAVHAPCSHGGVFEQVSRMMAREGLSQERMGWVTPDLKIHEDKGEDLLYIGCSPYFAAYFGGETADGLQSSLLSAVRLLNRAGITPTLLTNERCCGYHRRLAGEVTQAEALEERVVAQIKESGAKRVITICPECLVALRDTFRRHGVATEVAHLSELLAPRAESLKAKPDGGSAVTYHDPCRLGRYARIFDAPRQLLKKVAGSELHEMNNIRERSICCGNTAWLHCNAATRALQLARIEEGAATGSDTMITACPACYIHLRCAQEGLSEDAPAAGIRIVDLWTHLASAVDAAPASSPTTAAATSGGGGAGKSRKRRKTSK